MIDLDDLIRKTNELAPLPASTVRLAEMVAHGGADLQDVAELISFDQALTARLLRAANSAGSAGVLAIGTVQEAVGRIGTAQVLALAVASGARPLLKAGIPSYQLDEGELWRHSVAAAVAAETIPNFVDIEVPPETFTAALLHDVGKLIMGRFLDEQILSYLEQARGMDHLTPLEAESLLLGVNHAELGGVVAQHWQLPVGIVHGITYHHNPALGAEAVGYVTCVANLVAKRIQAGAAGRVFEIHLANEVSEFLGLSAKAFDEYCPVAASRYLQVSRRYNAV